MTTLDPSTGRALPDSSIQRVLFTSPKVHVYAIPPLTSTRGFQAGPWTAPPRPTAKQIFTARIRVIETSTDGKLKTDIVLEDPSTGDLFAAAPYTSREVVQAATDSSRFFAVRVVGEGGMKATLGIGFEERGEAMDFGIALADERKVLGMGVGAQEKGRERKDVQEVKRDWGLKEGESIIVEIGGKGRTVRDKVDHGEENKALFSIAPPPGGSGGGLPPPPSASEVKADNKKVAQDLGFDDGEFGEFQ
ncbi:Adaptin ear-binding coat-associated protein 2 [Sphaceloma murrayae]|uniref:Adaptin ear-binding coat-associated protein 2 n=1 Tax=Sphaceloma murrayae TaxID=2082308 RepID=A0A2K1QUW9_9PEZI|nr:Adaptin ear-binding coat-associated protein 2 [Sphaceloma murrayae]